MIAGFSSLTVYSTDVTATQRAYDELLGADSLVHVVDSLADHVKAKVGFAALDPIDATRRLVRRGASEIEGGVEIDGLPVGISAPGARSLPADIAGIDHIVVHTADARGAIATYGGRLGLDLRLERIAPQWGGTMLFFRCGDAVLEVIEPADEASRPAGLDEVWGIAWRSHDLQATASRIAEGGLEPTEIRSGRKPGTSVMTLRQPNLILPTLLISHSPH